MPQSPGRRIAALCLAAAGLACQAAMAGRLDFGQETPSPEARLVGDWASDSNDHGALPFVIVDKRMARVFVFDAGGTLKGAAPALLGLASGDDSVPGIGQRAMASIRPDERTTPAGRFVASLELSLQGDEILWVDYDAAIAMHPVASAVAKERRLERLVSRTASDHRITYGCINVAAAFFQSVVAPLFRGGGGVIYVLPETRSALAMFGAYDLAPGAARASVPPKISR
jgi:hypothetical protein